MTAQERFETYVDKTAMCWLWTGGASSGGYGQFWLDGKTVSAHRQFWEWNYGPIELGLSICHQCDVKLCVRLSHLFLGTAADNYHDCLRKGRSNMVNRRGEQHWNSKLTATQIKSIRTEFSTPDRVLAQRYGVSRERISEIQRREGWAHVVS